MPDQKCHAADHSSPNRRRFLGASLAASLAGQLSYSRSLTAQESTTAAAANDSIKQSICFWCFNIAGDRWDVAQTCQVAKDLGCVSVELVDPTGWPIIEKHGLRCAISPCGMPDPPFIRGWNNPAHREELVARTRTAIEKCAAAGIPNVIAFTGYKWREPNNPESGAISLEEGADNCVAGLKQILTHAEKHGVNLCLEPLNTRDDTHPAKGHPGYQGDDLDYVTKIIRRVDSPNLKLLFDVYHIQVMNGDIQRRLEETKDILGHVHTAGNPGRGELDEKQEINYAGVMRKLVEMGYEGVVGHEFIPTRDPRQGLREAVELCRL